MRKIFAAICAAVMLLCGALFAGCASSELEEYDVSDMVVFGSNWEAPNQNPKFIAFNIPFVTALIEVTAERGGFETSKITPKSSFFFKKIVLYTMLTELLSQVALKGVVKHLAGNFKFTVLTIIFDGT